MLLSTVCEIDPGMNVLAEKKKRLAPSKTVPAYLKGTKCANKACSVELDHVNCHVTWGQFAGRPFSFYTYCKSCSRIHGHQYFQSPKLECIPGCRTGFPEANML